VKSQGKGHKALRNECATRVSPGPESYAK